MIISVKKLNVDGVFSNSYLVTYANDRTPARTPYYVPHSEDNSDYRDILKWVAEGNTIEEAD